MRLAAWSLAGEMTVIILGENNYANGNDRKGTAQGSDWLVSF